MRALLSVTTVIGSLRKHQSNGSKKLLNVPFALKIVQQSFLEYIIFWTVFKLRTEKENNIFPHNVFTS